ETHCFNYQRQGYESREDCIDRCQVTVTQQKYPHKWPRRVNAPVNSKAHFVDSEAKDFETLCRTRCKHVDCTNEYYMYDIKSRAVWYESIFRVKMYPPTYPNSI